MANENIYVSKYVIRKYSESGKIRKPRERFSIYSAYFRANRVYNKKKCGEKKIKKEQRFVSYSSG